MANWRIQLGWQQVVSQHQPMLIKYRRWRTVVQDPGSSVCLSRHGSHSPGQSGGKTARWSEQCRNSGFLPAVFTQKVKVKTFFFLLELSWEAAGDWMTSGKERSVTAVLSRVYGCGKNNWDVSAGAVNSALMEMLAMVLLESLNRNF